MKASSTQTISCLPIHFLALKEKKEKKKRERGRKKKKILLFPLMQAKHGKAPGEF